MKYDFTNVRKWVSGDRFVGREKECGDLMKHIRDDLSSAVVGLRRIGKTSVLKEVRRRLCGVSGVVVIDVDMECFTGELPEPEATFYEFLLERLDDEFRGDSDSEHCVYYPVRTLGSEEPRVIRAFTMLQNFLKRFHDRTEGRIVLLLDEFDICAKWGDRMCGFLQRFRSLIDESPDYGFVCVLASSRAIKMLEAKTVGDASTLDNALEKVYLKPLASGDLSRLKSLSEAPVSETSHRAYFEYSFGHPFLYGLLLRRHNMLSRSGDVVDNPENVRDACLSDFENYFDELRHVFETFPVIKSLPDIGIRNWFECLVWREVYFANIPEHIEGIFRKYGLWNECNEMSSVLRDFLKRHQGDVWRELGCLERRLRSFVGGRLKAYYGNSETWFIDMQLPEHGSVDDPWRKKPDSFQNIVNGMRARRQKEQPEMAVDYLDCVYLDDLMHLMQIPHHWKDNPQKGWKGFGAYFGGDLTKCKEMIRAVGSVRNPEAHFIDYPDRLKLRFAEAEKYLSALLDNAERE